jgi:hypothetical protein
MGESSQRHSMVDLLTESRVPFRFVGLQPFCHGSEAVNLLESGIVQVCAFTSTFWAQ